MIRLATDNITTFYNLLTKNEPYDYMGLTPLGDKLIIIHDMSQQNQKIELFDTDFDKGTFEQLKLAISNYNVNKRFCNMPLITLP